MFCRIRIDCFLDNILLAFILVENDDHLEEALYTTEYEDQRQTHYQEMKTHDLADGSLQDVQITNQ